MATFEAQVQGLTGLTAAFSGSTAPTDTQLDQFLKDGVLDVTKRWLSVHSGDKDQFMTVSAEQTSNGFDYSGAEIVSVVRESGTNNDWRDCRKISPSMQAMVVDTESLHFASSFHPAYTILDNHSISVFPTPGSDPNAFKVYFINNSPQNASGIALTHAHDDIKYFPDDKKYLVPLYAAIQSLLALMASVHTTDSSGVDTALTAINTALDRMGSYNWGDSDTFTAGTAQLTRVKNALDQASDLINGNQPSAATDAFGAHADEDTEMVQSVLGIVNTELKRAQTHMQEWTSIGDTAMKEAQGFVAEAQARIGAYNQEYQWYLGRYQQLLGQYNAAFAPTAGQTMAKSAAGAK